jgi:nickel transport protein
MKPENRILALSAVFLVLYASPARAHGMKIFATAEGSKISGYAYFIPKGRPKNVLITVFDSAGNKLGETRTDEQGNFTFVATKRCDHVFVLNNGDGHKTRFVVSAEELPESLPGEKTPSINMAPSAAPVPTIGKSNFSATDEDKVAAAVAHQIRPLREQLDRLESKIRTDDIVGGIGIIFGITGAAFYLLGRKNRGK